MFSHSQRFLISEFKLSQGWGRHVEVDRMVIAPQSNYLIVFKITWWYPSWGLSQKCYFICISVLPRKRQAKSNKRSECGPWKSSIKTLPGFPQQGPKPQTTESPPSPSSSYDVQKERYRNRKSHWTTWDWGLLLGNAFLWIFTGPSSRKEKNWHTKTEKYQVSRGLNCSRSQQSIVWICWECSNHLRIPGERWEKWYSDSKSHR